MCTSFVSNVAGLISLRDSTAGIFEVTFLRFDSFPTILDVIPGSFKEFVIAILFTFPHGHRKQVSVIFVFHVKFFS